MFEVWTHPDKLSWCVFIAVNEMLNTYSLFVSGISDESNDLQTKRKIFVIICPATRTTQPKNTANEATVTEIVPLNGLSIFIFI